MKTVWTGPRHGLKYFWYVSGPALALACFALILLQIFAITSRSAEGSPLITPTASNTFTRTNTATITPGGPTLTPTNTPTNTPTPTLTWTPTNTPTNTPTITPGGPTLT